MSKSKDFEEEYQLKCGDHIIETTLEERINQYLDSLGLVITDPNSKNKDYFIKPIIPMLNSSLYNRRKNSTTGSPISPMKASIFFQEQQKLQEQSPEQSNNNSSNGSPNGSPANDVMNEKLLSFTICLQRTNNKHNQEGQKQKSQNNNDGAIKRSIFYEEIQQEQCIEQFSNDPLQQSDSTMASSYKSEQNQINPDTNFNQDQQLFQIFDNVLSLHESQKLQQGLEIELEQSAENNQNQ